MALDVPDIQHANALVDSIGEQVGAFKIGMELFTAAGPEIIRNIRKRGIPVCLDIKYHDIPKHQWLRQWPLQFGWMSR